MMGDVYRQAVLVDAWLGTEPSTALVDWEKWQGFLDQSHQIVTGLQTEYRGKPFENPDEGIREMIRTPTTPNSSISCL
jgi:hypothetical protein